ncbi:MAG: DMT family transporter [Verrucomicrobiota bacterium]|nr:DMT family transporter [Verrucomicrobiota bacterium]
MNRTRLSIISIILLLFGVLCCATSVLMIKASHVHPTVLSAYRLLLSALLLSPFYAGNFWKHRHEYSVRHLHLTLLPGLALALHFITWMQGAKWTHAANATLIVSMVPIAMPFILFFKIGEVITKAEVVGTLLAMGGAVWLTASDFFVSRQSLLGDVTCFVSMLLFSYYLAQARTDRSPNIWLYLVPLYAVAGVICLVVALFVAHPFAPLAAREYLLVLGLVVVPTILGHSILNHAMKQLSAQVVGVVNLFQFLFAGALAYFLFGEVPRPVFYAAGALVVAGSIIVIGALAATPESERKVDLAATPEL